MGFIRQGTVQGLARVGRKLALQYCKSNIMTANSWRRTPLRLQNTKAGRDNVEEAAKSAAGSFMV
jgi:hypothetical protein